MLKHLCWPLLHTPSLLRAQSNLAGVPLRVAVCLALVLIPRNLPASRIELISAASPSLASDSGGGASAASSNGSRTVSADGRFTVFTSVAANLVPGQSDHNAASDVFLYDRTAGALVLVSHAASGTAVAANGSSDQPVISGDGNRVAYTSTATDLVSGQMVGGSPNVFLWDRTTGTNVLVSHTAASPVTPASRPSGGRSALSQNGRWLVFSSAGTDLVAGQSGPAGDRAGLFLFDAKSGNSVLVTHDAAAAATVADGSSEGPVLSADGRYAAYQSSATTLVPGYTSSGRVSSNIYLWDRTTGTNTLVSHAAGSPAQGGSNSQLASISADGRWIAYDSPETNLVAGITDGNLRRDVFLYDRDAGTNQLVDHPVGSATTTPLSGAYSPVISADGGWIVFFSEAMDLVTWQTEPASRTNLFVTERTTGNTVLITHTDGEPASLVDGSPDYVVAVSDEGSWIAYADSSPSLTPGDGNGKLDVFLYDRAANTNTLVSHRAGAVTPGDGHSFAPCLSADGSFVAFASDVSDLDAGSRDLNGARDIFLYDRAAGTNALISKRTAGLPSLSAGGDSSIDNFPSRAMSHDGRWIAFTSAAVNLVAGQVDTNGGTDVFLRDRTLGTTILVSRSNASATTAGDAPSSLPSVSDDGRWVAFSSTASNLVPGQVAGRAPNVFLFDRLSGTTTLVSHASGSATQGGNSFSSPPALSADGTRIAFVSAANNLVAGATDTNAGPDVFLYDRLAGTTTLVSHAAGLPLTAANDESLFPRMVDDGNGVLFESLATNLASGQSDTNERYDLFFFDPVSGGIELVSHINGAATAAGNGGVGLYVVSRDGRWILYDSWSSDLIPGVTDITGGNSDVFLYDRQSGSSSLVSHAAGDPSLAVSSSSEAGDLSPDGRWIAFTSTSTHLVSGQTYGFDLNNIFLQDRWTGTTTLVSHVPNQPTGSPCCAGGAFSPRLSGDGSKVAYTAYFTNLVAGQSNQGQGVFLYDRLAGETAVVSHTPASPTQTGNGSSKTVEMSADASAIVFTSTAEDLVTGDFNSAKDVFVYTDGVLGAFYILTPCRLLDTRRPADGPALFSGQTKVVHVHGSCGIPDTAKALAVNITVVQPSGAGYLTLHPGDVLPAATGTITFSAGQTLANNAIQRLAVNTTGTVAMTPRVGGNGTVHVVIDIAGYFE